MSKISHVTLKEGAPIRLTAGEYFAESLLVESGIERRVSIVLEAGAKLHATAFVLATGGTASLSLTVDLVGEGAGFHLHALHIASGYVSGGVSGAEPSHADIDVRVNHLAPDCTSRQLIKGIAADEATGTFTGMVHVAPGSQRTDASQRNQNLQLSDSAHIFTRPGLEIYADDVKCSHGATVGRLDEEAVYYMQQRGVSEAEARRMQLQGFAAEIINHSPAEASREELTARITGIIDIF